MSRLSGISIAKVVPDLSTQDVLTTEWVNGEKLSESQAEDVRTLCNTLLNAYLIQLLETGFLHADPHPGERSSVVLLLYWLAVGGWERSGIVPVDVVQLCTGGRTMNQLCFLLRTPTRYSMAVVQPATLAGSQETAWDWANQCVSGTCVVPVCIGNLLRTPEGKICILDYGLMTYVTEDQR